MQDDIADKAAVAALVDRVHTNTDLPQKGCKNCPLTQYIPAEKYRITSYNVCYTKLLRANELDYAAVNAKPDFTGGLLR